MFETIETVVFDFGGVLIDLYREKCVEAFRAIGYPQAEEMISLYGPSDILQKLEAGEITGEELVELIREDSGNREITYEQVQGAYIAFLGTIPVVKLRAIRALREAGFKVCGLSNINEFVMPYVRERLFTADGLSMEEYIEEAYLSYEMGLLKPDAAIFERMIQESGLNPERTLFIDDSEKNIQTARSLGFQVYHAGPEEDFTPLLYDLIESRRKG
ncbi:MAG: HAD family phosphatase [Rikenellaceae bacterium]|nr:HAD family phosphatase [Rikenellaceae bacterium]